MKDYDNLAAIVGLAIIGAVVVVAKPEGAVLAMAGTVIGGLLTWLQRRSPQ